MDSVEENEIVDEQQGLGVLRIDIDMNDINNMSALVVGIIGMIKAKNGNVIPNEILAACQGNKIGTPKKSPHKSPRVSPKAAPMSINDKLSQFGSFFERYLVLDEKGAIGVTDLRESYNKATGAAETHVSFHRLIEEFMEHSGCVFTKKRMQKGVCYKGIRYVTHDEVKIPERFIQ